MSNVIEDSQLVENAVRNAGRCCSPPRPRWAAVTEALAVGSTSAGKLCQRFGLDPGEMVGQEFNEESEQRSVRHADTTGR